MIYQTTQGIHEKLHDFGCYFLCVLKIFELISGMSLTVKIVNLIYKMCVHYKYIDDEATIIKKAVRGIAQVINGIMNTNVYMRKMTSKKIFMYRIAMYTRTTTKGKFVTHFVLVDENGIVIYDPWSAEGSKTVRIGSIPDKDGYRYIYAKDVAA